MNNFTKDELNALRGSRCYHLDDNSPHYDALFMKLDSMIDNYCEHKGITSSLAVIQECSKCGKYCSHILMKDMPRDGYE